MPPRESRQERRRRIMNDCRQNNKFILSLSDHPLPKGEALTEGSCFGCDGCGIDAITFLVFRKTHVTQNQSKKIKLNQKNIEETFCYRCAKAAKKESEQSGKGNPMWYDGPAPKISEKARALLRESGKDIDWSTDEEFYGESRENIKAWKPNAKQFTKKTSTQKEGVKAIQSENQKHNEKELDETNSAATAALASQKINHQPAGTSSALKADQRDTLTAMKSEAVEDKSSSSTKIQSNQKTRQEILGPVESEKGAAPKKQHEDAKAKDNSIIGAGPASKSCEKKQLSIVCASRAIIQPKTALARKDDQNDAVKRTRDIDLSNEKQSDDKEFSTEK